jgi:hypothetical protein
MSNPSPLSSVQQELEKALKEVRVYLVNNGWGDHHGQTYMRRVQKHLLTASAILAALPLSAGQQPQPEGLIAAVQELRKRLDQWDDKQNTIAPLIAENNVWGAARAVAEYASQLSAASLPSGWQPIETAPRMRTILLFAVTDVAEDGSVRNWKMATGSWHTGYEDERSKERGYTPWNWDGSQLKAYQVQPTHWMPLPPAPAGEGQKP